MVLETLEDQGLVRIQWGGDIRLLRGEGEAREQSSKGAGPSFSGIFHGPLVYSSGEGAHIDTRGSGHGAAYKPGQLEAAFGALAVAVVELQTRLSELEGEAATKVEALEATARETVQGARAEPAKATLRKRLQALTTRLEDVVKLQTAVTKLEPTLTMIKNATDFLTKWLGS